MRPGAVLYLAACFSLGLVSPAEARGIGSPGMGPPGPAGERGEAGAQGPQGDRGPSGVPGSPGAKGDKGDAGPQGPKGDTGTAGQPGAAGERGPAGPTGATGQAGPKGDAGPQGVPGAQGLKGDAGAAGKDGLLGAAGQAGPQGSAGAPKRVERYTATANASGVATYSWTACTTTPDIDVIPGWVIVAAVQQMTTGGVKAQTLSGATVDVKVSQGTLALSGSPFRQADTGTPLTIRVICN